MEAAVDGVGEPDVLLLLGFAAPPVLPGDAAGAGVHARLPRGHVAEDLDGVQGATLVGVDPVITCSQRAPSE